jgi:tripartite-type tricarboxylate transporter receptor subunit TctC
VVPFAAGGPTDRVARDLGEAMRKAMGGQANFVVENVNGAGGTIGAARVAKASPDGHTLLVHHIGMAAAPVLYRKLSYKSLEDFEYLGMINEVPMTLIGKPQLPANTYRDFENYIRANAGKLNIAHAGLGSASHLCGLLWQTRLNASDAMVTIPFGGTAPAMNALVGGQVDVMCDQTTNTTGQIKAGKVKVFGVTSAKRIAALPDVPTLEEQGMKGFTVGVWHGVYAPKKTPPAVLDHLVTTMQTALRDPDFIKILAQLGTEPVAQNLATPAALQSQLKSEIAKWGPVIKKAGVYAD